MSGLATVGMLAAVQVTFALASILATVAISDGSANPTQDLSLLAALFAVQGLVRIIIGFNLSPDLRKNAGALWVSAALVTVAGVPFITLGYHNWFIAALPATGYETLRSWRIRRAIGGDLVRVAVADLIWAVPAVTAWLMALSFNTSPVVALGSLMAVGVLSLGSGVPLIRTLLSGPATWWRTHRQALTRSAREGLSGVVVPFAAIAVLATLGKEQEVNALRAAAIAVGPVGSAVVVVLFAWPHMSPRWRHSIGASLVIAPVAVGLIAISVPRLLSTLSGGSPDAVAFMWGWSAFGCLQSRLALGNADRRLGTDASLPRGGTVAVVAAVPFVAALASANSLATRVTITLVVAASLLAGTSAGWGLAGPSVDRRLV